MIKRACWEYYRCPLCRKSWFKSLSGEGRRGYEQSNNDYILRATKVFRGNILVRNFFNRFTKMQTCDYEFSLRRLRGDFVRSSALVDTQVSLVDTTHNENKRARIRRQQLNAIRCGQLDSILKPTA